MTSSWSDKYLEELADEVTVGHVGPMASEYVPSGIPFLRSKNVIHLRLDLNDVRYISEEFHRKLKKSALRPGDVVIVRTGKPGTCAVVPETLPVANCSDLVIVRPTADLDPRFLAYYVNSVAAHHIDSHLVGAVQQHFNVGAARKLLVHLPGIEEQRTIANILGTLDDKIELNLRMNETLEAMARAIFKSWFVDFDPVRAKIEGREPPGLSPELAALFPDSFEDSELGKIPAGWNDASLDEVVEVNPPRSLKRGEVAPYLDMKNMPTRGHYPGNIIDREFTSGTKFTCGDTLLARITPCLENGKTAFVDFLEIDEIAWGSTEYIVLRPREALTPEFVYYLARSDRFRRFAIQRMSGSSGRQRVPPTSLKMYHLAAPPPSVAEAFGNLVSRLMARVRANSEESQTLGATRDALLPRLLSGELRVP